MKRTSRLSGFYKKTMNERIHLLADMCGLSEREIDALSSQGALLREQADKMVENALGIYSLPFGVGLNFMVNGKEYLVPMAIEEPSVVASASHIAKIVRDAGGFQTEATSRTMIGQIQVIGCENFEDAKRTILEHKSRLIQMANTVHPSMVARGGGAKDIEVRLINNGVQDASRQNDSTQNECGQDNGIKSKYRKMLVLNLLVDTRDAMGANTINTMVEFLAPVIEELAHGKVYLRILSNYTDCCLAKARCVIPPALLKTGEFSGEHVRDGVVIAFEFADSDVYRAVTHNKGVMNGIDAVVIATGNDWRAIEAAAHAYACRFGHYRSMTRWSVDTEGNLVGELELPMPVGTVGGSIGLHPMAQIAHKLLGVDSAAELAQIIVSVGLAQNLGALKALATHGIQRGHMALHARSVAMTAGATGDMIDVIAGEMVKTREIRVSKAKELLELFS